MCIRDRRHPASNRRTSSAQLPGRPPRPYGNAVTENLRWYTKAIYGMDHVVRLAPAGAWDNASPCEGWTARHVIGHVIAVQRAHEALVEGRRRPMNVMVDTDAHAGDDPARTWADARDAVLAALDRPGVLRRVVKS